MGNWEAAHPLCRPSTLIDRRAGHPHRAVWAKGHGLVGKDNSLDAR